VKVEQFYPPQGDKVYHEQVINIKLFSSEHQTHVQKFILKAEGMTEFKSEAPFKPVAALLNSSNLGYARVLLDSSSISYFL